MVFPIVERYRLHTRFVGSFKFGLNIQLVIIRFHVYSLGNGCLDQCLLVISLLGELFDVRTRLVSEPALWHFT